MIDENVEHTDGDAKASRLGRGHPRLLFASLMVGNMSKGLAFTPFVSALPQMARDFGKDGVFVAQMTVAMASLGLFLGSLVSGYMLERCGTRRILLCCTLAYGVVGAGGMILRDPTLLLISRFVVGLISAFLATTGLWGISAEYAGAQRARVFGIATSFGSFTALTGTVLGGFIAQRWGWAMTFATYPVFGLFAFAIGAVSMKQVLPERLVDGQMAPYLFRLFPFFLLVTILFGVMFMSSAQLSFLLADDGIVQSSSRSLVISFVTIVATVVSFFYGWVLRRLSAGHVILVGLLCATGALIALGLGETTPSAVSGAALFGTFVGLVVPYIYQMASERSDVYTRGRAVGFTVACSYLGGFLNPLIVAPIIRAVGMHGTFLCIAGLVALLLIVRIASSRVRAIPVSRVG